MEGQPQAFFRLVHPKLASAQSSTLSVWQRTTSCEKLVVVKSRGEQHVRLASMTVRSKGGAVPYIGVEGAQVGDELRCRQRRSIQAFAALMAASARNRAVHEASSPGPCRSAIKNETHRDWHSLCLRDSEILKEGGGAISTSAQIARRVAASSGLLTCFSSRSMLIANREFTIGRACVPIEYIGMD